MSDGERAGSDDRDGGAAAIAERSCLLTYESGLHVRAASVFVRKALRFRSMVTVQSGAASADGKSVMELLSLAAAHGSTLRIMAEGPDAQDAAGELAELVEHGFELEDPS
jgi:phosphotransferase system HPr (HPr) family protein